MRTSRCRVKEYGFGAALMLTVTALVVCVGETHARAAADEFRAMWVSRFGYPPEWVYTDLATCKAHIDEIMQKLNANNFNAVVFQMRGQADTLYPSPYEPWSPLLSTDGNTPPGWEGFDPMAYAINKAHENGLEFHAYLNAHVCWGGASAPTYCGSPTDRRHLYWEHCNVNDPAHRDWLLCNSSGTPLGYDGSEYVWIAPGIPDFQAYWRKQIMYVVTQYDGSNPVTRPAVDGVHFDRIRTPTTGYSYDPISQSRRLGDGNPAGLSFADWQRDQITRTLCDLYAQINEYTQNQSSTHHRVKVSSAPLGMHSAERYTEYGYPVGDCAYGGYGYSCKYQDAQGWLAAGAQDFIVPQIYWADEPWRTTNPHFSQILPDWIAHNAGRHIYPGCNVSATGPGLLSEVNVTRTMGGQGDVIWSYSGFNNNNYWPLYSGPGGPYEEPANTPAMPWKDSPTDGIILGTVTDGTDPIVDAHITRTGSSYTALSSADALYSFLKVPPATYTLTYEKSGFIQTTRQVSVAAGQVVRVPEVVLVLEGPPTISDVQAGTVTSSGATITWMTNAASDSQVEYGTTTSYGSTSTLNPTPVTSHSVVLSGLSPNTLYHYRVRSVNAGGTAYSDDNTFTTASPSNEVIVDNLDPGFTFLLTPPDGWNIGTASIKYGSDYFWCYEAAGADEASATAKARWTPDLPVAGTWDVYIWYARGSNRSTNTYLKIINAGTTLNLRVNQELNGNGWTLLAADVPFDAGTAGNVQMWNNTGLTGTNQVIQGDSARFVLKIAAVQPPTIVQQPAAQNVCPAGTAVFTVSATGEGTLTYQWRKNGGNISDGGHYSGATTATLTVTGADTGDAASYTCVVTNSGGSTSSSIAGLTLKSPTSIEEQPQPLSVNAGDTAMFTVAGTGEGALTYRWQKDGADIDDDGHFTGTTTGTLTICDAVSDDAGDYRCAITADCGTATSNAATLTVNTPSYASADFDRDNDVDLLDFSSFQMCFNGPNNPPRQSGCDVADLDGDTDVDLMDFAEFQTCFNGPNLPPRCL